MPTFDPNRLKVMLVNTGLQTTDNSLFQVINQLIDISAAINTQSSTPGATGPQGLQGIGGASGIHGINGFDGEDGVDSNYGLNSTGVASGIYGSSTAIPSILVDSSGRIISAASATPQLTLTGIYFSSLAGTNLTGTAASLSIGGNAGTVTNGVYTSGSYSDPSWITGLAGSKISGNISGSSGSTTGNAATATALQSGRTINGVIFDGTINITAAAAAGTLTGDTLAAGVTASSLTSVGTLTGGSTGVGFTVTLSTSTITGTLADARLSTNVPLLNAANVFTAAQTISKANSQTSIVLTTVGASDGYAGMQFINAGGQGVIAQSRSAGGDIFIGSQANAFGIGTLVATPFQIGTNGIVRMTMSSSGSTQFSQQNNFSWNAKSVDTVYGPANTDGFVLFTVQNSAVSGGIYTGLSDTSNPPTTSRCVAGNGVVGVTDNSSFLMPVRNGDYWKVLTSVGGGTYLLFWVPNGTHA